MDPVTFSSKEITESQNHRMVGVGRDLCGSYNPTPLPEQGHPEQAAQDLVQADLEYLQRSRLHHLSGQPVIRVFSHDLSLGDPCWLFPVTLVSVASKCAPREFV